MTGDTHNTESRRGQWSDRDYARLTHALASTPLFQSAGFYSPFKSNLCTLNVDG